MSTLVPNSASYSSVSNFYSPSLYHGSNLIELFCFYTIFAIAMLSSNTPGHDHDRAPYKRLQDWLLNSGSLIQNVTIAFDEHDAACRRLQATANVDPGSALIRIPPNRLITVKTAHSCKFVNEILTKAAEDGLDTRLPNATEDSAAIMLLLLAELSKGKSSPWHPWLDSLPSRFVTPLTVDEDVIFEALEGTPALSLVQVLRVELRELYDEWFVPYALKKYPHVFDYKRCSYDGFLYAHAVFESRAFKIDNTTVLAPFADMANHAGRGTSACNARVRGWAMEEAPDALGLELYVGNCPINNGDEIRICYGSLANWELLVHFGFVDSALNPDDSVVVQLEGTEDGDLKDDMRRLLILQVVCGDSSFDFSLSLNDPLPTDLVKCARVLLLQGSDLDGGIHTNYDQMVSVENERAVIDRLNCIIDGLSLDPDESHDSEDGSDTDDETTKQLLRNCKRYVVSLIEIANKARVAIDKLESSVKEMEASR